ncbi:hypothetical protein [uncultured Dubosiella sp.]|uniref:hypothetical protein n=1 Tax=uncultured Dubosiella sp. TaxID=1937011 RepID=UPI002729D1CF|nr:hypothetical protein [uncultured Dubosiella sp.]
MLGLLVGATKSERQKDAMKFNIQDQLMTDLRWIRSISLLKNSQLVASGPNYVLVETQHPLEADELNEMEFNIGFLDYFEGLLGTPKKLFAVPKAQYERVVRQFRERMASHDLPEPVVVELKKEQKTENTKKNEEDLMTKVFPTIQIFED